MEGPGFDSNQELRFFSSYMMITYIILDVLVCRIDVCFYEPARRVKTQKSNKRSKKRKVAKKTRRKIGRMMSARAFSLYELLLNRFFTV